MPDYTYTILTSQGKKNTLSGFFETDAKLVEDVAKQGAVLIKRKAVSHKVRQLSKKELLFFFTYMQRLSGVGIELQDILSSIYEEERGGNVKAMVGFLLSKIRQGKKLSEAMQMEGRSFSDVQIRFILLGEASNTMTSALERIVRYMTASNKAAQKIKRAMMYPAVLITLITGMFIAAVRMVVPKFKDLLKIQGTPIPPQTEFMIKVVDFLVANYIPILSVIFGATIFLILAPRLSKKMRYIFDRAKLRLPFFGGIIVKMELSRFAVFLSALLNSGATLVDATAQASNIISNAAIARDVAQIVPQLNMGRSFSDCVSDISYAPVFMRRMVRVGQESNQLQKSLEDIYKLYSEEVEISVDRFISMLKPMGIIVAAAMLGFLLSGTMMPMYQQMYSMSAHMM